MHLSPFFLMAVLVALLIGFSKGGLGGTAGALATPLMALVMPVDQVIGLMLPLLMATDIFAVASHWKRWDGKIIWLMLPGAVVGVTIGTFFITNAPTALLKTTLGVIVLLFAVYKLLETRLFRNVAYEPRDWHGIFAGTVAGFASALAHTGGPPVSMYLLLRRVPTRTFNATSALFFAIINWVKVPYYFYAGLFDFEQMKTLIWLLPLLPLGVWGGKWLAERISREMFERVVVVLLVVTAVFLILE
ncbi:MAG TPA: sulfite exporter TauE/SafE family protein [Anaerolineales bacterium]|nr:sulfite exporter TauE/SafE family protein [Anaerolineales bacterium]